MPNEVFLAVGHNGLRMTSADGVEWKNIQPGKEGQTYRFAAFGNGQFVGVGNYGGSNIFAASADGVTWKTQTKDAKYSQYVAGLRFGNGIFLANGGDPGSVGSSDPFTLTSKDGETWTEPVVEKRKHILRNIVFGNGRWVGVGDRGRRGFSTDDGKTWTDLVKPKATETLINISFGAGRFVGVGLHGARSSSEDGAVWTQWTRGEEGEHINSIIWTGEQFVAIGLGGTYISPDGQKWERRPNKNSPLTAVYARGIFVGAHWKGRVFTSKDGVDWTESFRSENHVEGLAVS